MRSLVALQLQVAIFWLVAAVGVAGSGSCIKISASIRQRLRTAGYYAVLPTSCDSQGSEEVVITVHGAVQLEGLSSWDFSNEEVQTSFSTKIAAAMGLKSASNVTISNTYEIGGVSDDPSLVQAAPDDNTGADDSLNMFGRGGDTSVPTGTSVTRRLDSVEQLRRLDLGGGIGMTQEPLQPVRRMAQSADVQLNVEYSVAEATTAGNQEAAVQALGAKLEAADVEATLAEALTNVTGKTVSAIRLSVLQCPDSYAEAVQELAAGRNESALCSCQSGATRTSTWVFSNATGWHDKVYYCIDAQAGTSTPLLVELTWRAGSAALAAVVSNTSARKPLVDALRAAHGTAVDIVDLGQDSMLYRAASGADGVAACPSQEIRSGLTTVRVAEPATVSCRDLRAQPLLAMPPLSEGQWQQLDARALDTVPHLSSAKVTAISPNLLHLTLVPGWTVPKVTGAEGDFTRPLVNQSALNQLLPQFSVCPVGSTACQVPVGIGLKRRQLWAPLDGAGLHMGEHIFLQLTTAVAGDFVATMPGPAAGGAGSISLRGRYDADGFGEVLHLSHYGYRPEDRKKAFAGLFLGTLGELPLGPQGFQVLRLGRDGQRTVAFDGQTSSSTSSGWPARFAPQIYQHVLMLDFSSLTAPGRYVVALPPYGVSMPFDISDHAFRRPLMVLSSGLYHARCGIPLELPWTQFLRGREHELDGFVYDNETMMQWFKEGLKGREGVYAGSDIPRWRSTLEGEHVEATGGHHDAGDYGKYTHNGAKVVWAFFTAFDHFDKVILDHDDLGLPNSRNGVSDMLEEALWEVKWLMNMQDPTDGGVFQILKPPGAMYEFSMPHRDIQRVLLPKDSIPTAAYAAALARAARSPVLKRHDVKLAEELGRRARKAWRWLSTEAAIANETNHSADTNDQVFHYGQSYGSRDERALAALELYALTGAVEFRTAFEHFYRPEAKVWTILELPEFFGFATETCALWSLGVQTDSGRESLPPLSDDMLMRCRRALRDGADSMMGYIGTTPYEVMVHYNAKSWHTVGWHFPTSNSFELMLAHSLDPIAYKLIGRGICQGPAEVGASSGLWWSTKRSDDIKILETKDPISGDRQTDTVRGLQRCRDACRANDACVGITYGWVGYLACRFHCKRPVVSSGTGDAALLSCSSPSAWAGVAAGVANITVQDMNDTADALLGNRAIERYCLIKAPGAYLEAALAQVHYVFGSNPLDASWVTGSGWRRLRSSVDQETVFDGIGEPVSGIPVSPVVTGAYWLDQYGRKLGWATVPTGNPWVQGQVYPMLDQPYDGWNVMAEFTIDHLVRFALVVAAVTPASMPGASGIAPVRQDGVEHLHPRVQISAQQDLMHGHVDNSLNVLSVGGSGICAVRWTADQSGTGKPMSLGPVSKFDQNYAEPLYRLSVEVEDCGGLRGWDSMRLNTRDYNNTAIPLAPLVVTPGTLLLMHLDGDFRGSTLPPASIKRTGDMFFDGENLDWLDFRSQSPKGEALRLAGGDSMLSTVFSGRVLDRSDIREIRLEALMYIEDLFPRGAKVNELISLTKTWRDCMVFNWDRWDFRTAVKFGEYTVRTGEQFPEVSNFNQWHFVKLTTNATHFTFCIDGRCDVFVDPAAPNAVKRWSSAEDFRLTVGNFKGLLDEVHVYVQNGGRAPEAQAWEACQDTVPAASSITWLRLRTDLGNMSRTGGLCRVPQWLNVYATQPFIDDDLSPLTLDVIFVRGKSGAAGWHPPDASSYATGFGVRAEYDGLETLQIKSNNLGYAPQTFVDRANITTVLGRGDTYLLVRIVLCGKHLTTTMALASAPSASTLADVKSNLATGVAPVLVGKRYVWRFSPPPTSFVLAANGQFSGLRAFRSVSSNCWEREDLVRPHPPVAESFVDDCEGSSTMWGYTAKLPGAWRPRFEQVGGEDYTAEGCTVVTDQFAQLYKQFFAAEGQPLLAFMRVAGGKAAGMALFQDTRGDGFSPFDGIGIAFSRSGSTVSVRTNNLGFAPQTISASKAVDAAAAYHLLVSVCAQRVTAWVWAASSNRTGPFAGLPDGATPFYSSGGNWRFYPSSPWMARLSAGTVKHFELARPAPSERHLFC